MLERAMPSPILRFAPSPNGYLHLGHAYSALFTDYWATRLGGAFLLGLRLRRWDVTGAVTATGRLIGAAAALTLIGGVAAFIAGLLLRLVAGLRLAGSLRLTLLVFGALLLG